MTDDRLLIENERENKVHYLNHIFRDKSYNSKHFVYVVFRIYDELLYKKYRYQNVIWLKLKNFLINQDKQTKNQSNETKVRTRLDEKMTVKEVLKGPLDKKGDFERKRRSL